MKLLSRHEEIKYYQRYKEYNKCHKHLDGRMSALQLLWGIRFYGASLLSLLSALLILNAVCRLQWVEVHKLEVYKKVTITVRVNQSILL